MAYVDTVFTIEGRYLYIPKLLARTMFEDGNLLFRNHKMRFKSAKTMQAHTEKGYLYTDIKFKLLY